VAPQGVAARAELAKSWTVGVGWGCGRQRHGRRGTRTKGGHRTSGHDILDIRSLGQERKEEDAQERGDMEKKEKEKGKCTVIIFLFGFM